MKKNYGVSVDNDTMEAFKEKCRVKNIKYSHRLEELLKADSEPESIASMETVKQIVKLRESVDNLLLLHEKVLNLPSEDLIGDDGDKF